ncbi:NAD(P)/FAD-dependent oxidoreductase [Spirilliplanes yamanashiensis]|uniref:Glycerol-3-phosphate dehydrogenase n=1 Tax=Spirilliplanes yamanashiensis TaxID=42233 RepID=A0A8J4DLP3_9ACTN|nr:FAD-dependent oxidoreductase [Spirilliplanes yamanashiensis]MDP9816669.1 D-arginine dehydrogenase [Spirilliplanes yamanashiensis]GIJ06191.1 glycerol-3-phosphate dehydrogenase [Spirilliplanes yamanashiensis]
MIEADVAVVGAGIAGVSVAAELSGHRSVVVLEQEAEPAYHTTGRSAAMFLESYGGPDVRALTAAGRAFLDAVGTLLTPRPLLWVAGADGLDRLAALAREQPALVPLSPDEAVALCPALRSSWCAGALLEPRALEIDVLGLHQHYLGAARRDGVRVLLGARVLAGRHTGGRWVLDTAAGPVAAAAVVNAAGAWADPVAAALGAPPVGLRPLRRTAAVARADGVDRTWPLVSDVAETFYFRPEGAGVLLSPADETPSEPCDARPDELDVALAIERVNAATTLGLRSVVTAWAGLRTFAPDRNPVAGPDPAAPGLWWLAGQGGYGIQTAPELARLVAASVAGGDVPAAVSVARFRRA